MPEAPAATPVLSTTTTSSPARARCQAVERPWTPAPTTRGLTELGGEGGTGGSFGAVAYHEMALPQRRRRSLAGGGARRQRPASVHAPIGGPTTIVSGYGRR